MDFHCERCGQKYQVADEKLQGRGAVRFRCRKCENLIAVKQAEGARPATQTVSAPSSVASVPRAASVPRVASVPRAAPVARPLTVAPPARAQSAFTAPRASVGRVQSPEVMAAASVAPVLESPALPSTAALLDASENDWYAGIRDLPVGPLTRKELAQRASSGDVDASTLVWREGMAEWLPLREVQALRSIAPVARLVLIESVPAGPLTPIPSPPSVEQEDPKEEAREAKQSVAGPGVVDTTPLALRAVEKAPEVAAPLAESLVAPVLFAPVAPAAAVVSAPVVSAPVVAPTERRSSTRWVALPLALLACVGVFGVARVLSRSGTPATPVAPTAPLAQAPVVEETRVAVVAPVVAASVVAAPVVAAPESAPAEASAPPAEELVGSVRHHHHAHEPAPVAAPRGLSAADRAMLGSAGNPPPAAVAVPGADNMRLARPPATQDAHAAHEPSFAVRLAVGNALQRSGIVRQCWDQQQRLDPGVQPSRIHITAQIDASGHVTGVSASGAEAWMTGCIHRGAARVTGTFQGGPFSVTTPFDLDH